MTDTNTAPNPSTDDVDLGEEWETDPAFVVITDYNATVVGAMFAPSTFDASFLEMVWTVTTDLPEYPTTQIKLGVGKGWATFDGGASATRVDGGSNHFGEGMLYGKVLAAVKGDKEAAAQFKGRGSPKNAATFMGSKWWVGKNVRTYTDKKTGNEVTRTDPIPEKFLGFDAGVAAMGNGAAMNGGGTASTPTATATTTTTPPVSSPTIPAAPAGLNIPDDVRAKLAPIAKAAGSLDEFWSAAKEAGAHDGNQQLLASWYSEPLYNALRQG